MKVATCQRAVRVFLLVGLASVPSLAAAQIVSGSNPAVNPSNNSVLLPGLGTSPLAQSQLTPEQFQGMAQLRYLQSRRRGQVRTGYPQFIPFGPEAMMPMAGTPMDNQGADTTRKSSAQKRMEARKVRDEQKKAAREEAAAKKAKNGKPDKKDLAKAKKAKPAKPEKNDAAKFKKAKADLAKKKSG